MLQTSGIPMAPAESTNTRYSPPRPVQQPESIPGRNSPVVMVNTLKIFLDIKRNVANCVDGREILAQICTLNAQYMQHCRWRIRPKNLTDILSCNVFVVVGFFCFVIVLARFDSTALRFVRRCPLLIPVVCRWLKCRRDP